MTQQRWLLIAMLAAVSLVATALFVDEQQEFEAAVQDLKDEQIALATAVGADFETRLNRMEQTGRIRAGETHIESFIPELLGGAMKLEDPGERVLLVARPDKKRVLTTDGRPVKSDFLLSAMHSGVSGVILSRDEAPRFGLPPRIALAGIETIRSESGLWGVAVLASGERLRERERHAQLRFLLGFVLVTVIVSGFGGMAIRQQRHKLGVARALEISALERDREKLLAKADKMATLAALSSGIAHEVATPLGTIMARVEQVLPAIEGNASASSALEVVMEQVGRIQTTIRGVLGLARGEMPPLVPESPRTVAQGAVALSKHRFGHAGVRIELHVSANLPDIACDPPMLEQALTNLLLNACDASARGQNVRLLATCEEETLSFVVDDEGEGIDPETVARALEPFFTTKGRRGNGLGLAITREIVAHHGGKLRLEPRADGGGTRALIELPHL